MQAYLCSPLSPLSALCLFSTFVSPRDIKVFSLKDSSFLCCYVMSGDDGVQGSGQSGLGYAISSTMAKLFRSPFFVVLHRVSCEFISWLLYNADEGRTGAAIRIAKNRAQSQHRSVAADIGRLIIIDDWRKHRAQFIARPRFTHAKVPSLVIGHGLMDLQTVYGTVTLSHRLHRPRGSPLWLDFGSPFFNLSFNAFPEET